MEHHFLIHRTKSLPAGRQGFTLLELLISISIIGILIAAGVASYSTAQKRSRDSRRMSDLKAIQAGFEQYNADFSGSYPASCTISATYLPADFPKDPKTGGAYNTNPVNNSIGSLCSAAAYCFCVQLENITAGNATNDTCTYVAGGTGGTHYCVGSLQ